MTFSKPLKSNKCNVCQSNDVKVFFELLDVPVFCNVLWKNQKQAQESPKGDLRLGFCYQCGHIFNTSFQPQKITYTQQYENSLFYSLTFQEYAKDLAHRLIKNHFLYGKRLIEIGCGKGDFLRLLCKIGNNYGIGFDPSYSSKSNTKDNDLDIQFIEDTYSDKYSYLKADFIYSRHVLEHVTSPSQHILDIYKAIKRQSNTVLFIEVPNAFYTLKEFGLWDLIYEHCSYFSSQSLTQLLCNSGFYILHKTQTYHGQYLNIECKPATSPYQKTPEFNQSLEELTTLVHGFNDKYVKFKNEWISIVNELYKNHFKTVVWGAGSKGVTFLNALKIGPAIKYVVDISPRKQGKYTSGTGQKIVSPESLKSYCPDVVILLNPVYKDEVLDKLKSLNLRTELISIDQVSKNCKTFQDI